MNRFINALKQNLIINNAVKDIDITYDELKLEIQKLKKLKFDVSVPIYYSHWLQMIEEITIDNFSNSVELKELDYSALNEYSNLKTLIITHNDNIKSLNISKLKNLENLIIVGNKNLIQINGLDNLENLKNVIIVGNNIKNLNEFLPFFNKINNHQTNIFDVNMYDFIVNNNIDLSKFNVSYAEKINVGEIFILNQEMMKELYDNSIKIINKIIKDNMTDYEKVLIIYKYLVSNLEYDYDGLAKRNEYVKNNDIKLYSNDYKDINTSYKAIKDHRVVCEGYANLLKFLLNILKIEAENVLCHVKKEQEVFMYFYHMASKIKIDGKWYYFDSQLEDDSKHLKYFMKNVDEFSETHKLPNIIKRYRSK